MQQFGLRLFACRDWIPVLCLHLFLLAELGFTSSSYILYPFAFICFLTEIRFRFCCFGCICLHLFCLQRLDSGTKMWQQLCATPPPQSSPRTQNFLMWKENSTYRQQSSGGFGCHKHKAAADEEEESGKLELVLQIVVRFCKLRGHGGDEISGRRRS